MPFSQCASEIMEKVERHMEAPAKKGMHPLIAIAAVSVTLFSLVGIAAITGLIPTGHSQPAQVESRRSRPPPRPKQQRSSLRLPKQRKRPTSLHPR